MPKIIFMHDSPTVSNIPASAPFGRALARGLLDMRDENPDQFARTLVLLPTRRACRTLRETFLNLENGKPLILPRIQPIGDVDEEEITLWLGAQDNSEALLNLPPPIPPLRRQALMTQLIMKHNETLQYRQAFVMAEALCRFMDQILIEELDTDRLEDIVPEDFAAHWQITLDFLKILFEHWPDILKENGSMEAAQRRATLMDLMGKYWHDNPPSAPIIAAGSTGSIPSTARLLSAISRLPHGHVVLPGLDTDIDPASWNALPASHPQSGLKSLLDEIGIKIQDIRLWKGVKPGQINTDREFLAREMMRPAETCTDWTKLQSPDNRKRIAHAIEKLNIAHCKTPQDEAEVIAIALRKTLESKDKTAILVTPDRNLARRVAGICRRWNITLDDSAGQPLSKTPIVRFMNAALDAGMADFTPVSFLALLKNPYCRLGLSAREKTQALEEMELALRGLPPKPGLPNIQARLQNRNADTEHARHIMNRIKNAFEPALKIKNNNDKSNIYNISSAILHTLETLFEPHHGSPKEPLWQGEDGEALAQIFINIQNEAESIQALSFQDFSDLLKTLCDKSTIRPRYGTHPRLSILGQLEARMVDADFVILGGLNEGVWPTDTGHDPWMSRPMRRDFGLPDLERGIGLAAHDFVQALCRDHVLITRAEMGDGAPTIPSRWLSRLNAVLSNCDLDMHASVYQNHYAHLTQYLHGREKTKAIGRPAPVPASTAKLKKLSVTKIETLLKNPYAIYASHILDLEPLKPLEKKMDAADKGTVLHDILEQFIRLYPQALPDNAQEELQNCAAEIAKNFEMDEDFQAYWSARFQSLANWFIPHEQRWRKSARNIALESYGRYQIQLQQDCTFTLSGIADRIDKIIDGRGCAIIDYKSGGSYSKKSMLNGDKPQLLLEALMLQNGAFENITDENTQQIAFWKLTGGHKGGEIVAIEDNDNGDLQDAIRDTENNLRLLLETYLCHPTAFICQPRSQFAPAFDDYKHLSRIAEWGAEEEIEEVAV